MPKRKPPDLIATARPDPGTFPGSVLIAGSLGCQETDSRLIEDIQTSSNLVDHRVDQNPVPDDPQTWIIPAFAPILRDLVRRRPGDALDPEDATQEAWLVLVARVAAVRIDDGEDDLPPQLVVRIRNHLADLRRRARRRVCLPLADDLAEALVGREENPAVAFEQSQAREEVRAALIEAGNRLSRPSLRIVVLRWVEGRTFAEIAEILEMTVDRVRDRHRRALPVLRALLIRRFGADLFGLPPASPDVDRRTLELEEVTP
jgi:RNA polymerase sigma factor (sigma-70 family)